MEVLVAGRIIQGFGSGLLTVALYVVVGQLYPARLRPRIFAAFATGWVVPSLVGPAIAGLIVEHASWRIVFLAVPAIAIPAALVMRPGLARGAAYEARAGRLWDKRAMWAIAAAVGVGLLHYGGQQRGVLQVVLLVVGLAGVIAFAPRLLPSGTFTLGRGLPSVVALRGLVAAAGFGAEVFLPLMLTRERGLSPALAGLVLTVSALSWTAASWYRGRPNQPFSHSVFLQAGMVSILLGIATATLTLNDNVPVLVGILGWSLTGLGMGTVFPTLSVLTLEYSERDEQGANSSAAAAERLVVHSNGPGGRRVAVRRARAALGGDGLPGRLRAPGGCSRCSASRRAGGPRASASYSLDPVTAMLAPRPMIIRPPVPPTSSSRRGERANHSRAVPATTAQTLSEQSAIRMKIRPRTRICSPGRAARALVHELRQHGGEEDRGLGVGDPDQEPLPEGPAGVARLHAARHRLDQRLPGPERVHAEIDQVRRSRQLHHGQGDGAGRDQGAEPERDQDRAAPTRRWCCRPSSAPPPAARPRAPGRR